MIFDFSVGELGLIAVVALVVLGPERLPKVARTAGALMRRARTSWQQVQAEIERELEAEDLKRSLAQARQTADDLRNELHSANAQMEASMRTAVEPEKTAAPPLPDDAHVRPAADALTPAASHERS